MLIAADRQTCNSRRHHGALGLTQMPALQVLADHERERVGAD
jgi:hypothetical protein